jgi:hypothetical protein
MFLGHTDLGRSSCTMYRVYIDDLGEMPVFDLADPTI